MKRKKDETCIVEEYVLNSKLKDICPMYFSRLYCFGGTKDGPVKRNFTQIHYFLSGCGYYELGGKRYEIKEGYVFIVSEGVCYEINIIEDAEVICVAFDGELSTDFALIEPCFPSSADVFYEIMSAAKYEGRKDVFVASIIMKWYLELFPKKREATKDYITEIKEFVDENYMSQIKVEDIAAKFNMNRSYLSRVFKEKVGMTLKEYIIAVRLKEAKHMLNYGKNVTEAATLCGFGSQSHFSKTYKKFYSGVPKEQKNEREIVKNYSEYYREAVKKKSLAKKPRKSDMHPKR